ncbi:Protein Y75B7AR.1, partial [Aphelenchoides avenae]
PPIGYENILPPDTFKRLVAVHQNMSLSIPEKKKQVDAIMAEVPQETLEMLPLPPALYKLPATELNTAKKIFANKSLSFDEKNESVRKFIQSLPTHLKRLVRPPLPRGFENLPEETKDKIDELYEMDGLSEDERYNKIMKVVELLPPELRAKLPPPPQRQWPQK